MQPPRLQPAGHLIAGHFIAEQPNYFRKTGSAAHFQPSGPQPYFRNSGKPRIAPTNKPREDHCTPESFRIEFRMKCVGKTRCVA
jgi:hypothetical protein